MGRILLINKGWSDNIGDQAIKYALEKMIASQGHSCEFADLTKPQNVTGKSRKNRFLVTAALKYLRKWVPDSVGQAAWLLRHWPIFKKQFRNNHYDLVIIGGGQLILDNASFPLAVYLWMHLMKGLHRNKVVIYGVGASPALSGMDRMLYRSALKMADAVYLRDHESMAYILETFGITAHYTPDVVFGISRHIPEQPCKGTNTLIAPPCFDVYQKAWRNDPNAMTRDAYEAFWENKVMENLPVGGCAKLFYTAEQDIGQTQRLQDQLLWNQEIHVEIIRLGNLNDYTRELSHAGKVISGRMHALIIAFAFKKNLEVFPVSKKLTTFRDEYLNRGGDLEMIQDSVENTFRDMIAAQLS